MLGRRLKELRGKETQEKIAGKLGISRARYSHYENEHVQPDNDLLEKIADFFGVTIDYLVGRTNDKKAGDHRDPAEKLINYLEMELTDEEIMERMPFKVDDITLSVEEVKEFIAFVRAKRFMKSGQQVYPSKPEEL